MLRGGPAPLLPAKHQRRHGSSIAAAQRAQRRRHRSRWLVGTAVVLLTAVLVYLYRRAPQAQPQEAGSEEERRDNKAELQLLHEQPSPEFCARPPPLVCAHGGDINAAPPNTAAAFAAALHGGARCVEVDVARTKDGQLVVLHARELAQLLQLAGRPTTRAGGTSSWWRWGDRRRHAVQLQVGDLTWAELAELRWEGGERVEQVEDVVRQVQGGTDQITLDVKTYSQDGEEVDEDVMAQEVVNLVRRTACTRCLVWAKSDQVVRLVKELQPLQTVGYVVLNETAAARAAGMHRLLRMPAAEVIALHFALATAEVTAQARAAHKQVHVWTANTAGMMRAVLDAGVDAVVTNHPRKLADAVQSRLQRCREQQQRQQGRQHQQASQTSQQGQQGRPRPQQAQQDSGLQMGQRESGDSGSARELLGQGLHSQVVREQQQQRRRQRQRRAGEQSLTQSSPQLPDTG